MFALFWQCEIPKINVPKEMRYYFSVMLRCGRPNT
ncbi:hypothetical protein F441_09787 [Phytophthora nicotianae CJ01A1]|uniref:Uncharacterized protein n=3 Tax=Phytophthora nicotianae TaxID=4792 RepID=V9F286_PHYNI|nr:hypothetical protein F443_09839 [Phytophthora nicotianae P1569]ETO74304.1 hypothetical protein F444_09932 [Phytophthora nicotianae P1976]ETP15468.1 hypothetical protein F441_09787 [Phytophthora nicotianae CJ01A1]